MGGENANDNCRAPATLFQPAMVVSDYSYGDRVGTLTGTAQAQAFVYTGDSSWVYGERVARSPPAARAATTLPRDRVPLTNNILFGDAYSMDGSARGGNDRVSTSGAFEIYGDAFEISGRARGGSDRVDAATTATDAAVSAVGDAFYLYDYARGATTGWSPAPSSATPCGCTARP